MMEWLEALGWGGAALLGLHVLLHEVPMVGLFLLALLAPARFKRLVDWWYRRKRGSH